ncbi:MAG TPA: CBASS oligonucleotide cyclase [Mycobacterium sp.]|nr:CBASS oligonucleotide cyclase [Mycobacterium sp.]
MDVPDAFWKFKSRLEISDREERDAIRRREVICNELKGALEVDRDFLTGSYKRHTKTKPLKDVDIFVVMKNSERHYLQGKSDELLALVGGVLEPIYGSHRFSLGRHSVRIDFGIKVVDDVSDGVMSFDVVPAFDHEDGGYCIPYTITGAWVRTDPKVHEKLATQANEALDGKWKPVVKMLKKWNDHNGKPIKPSFLIEVMAIALLDGPFDSYPFDIRQFFSSAAETIGDDWPDPAGLGPPVNERLLTDAALLADARSAVRAAESKCTAAMRNEAAGRTGAALDTWQELFGPLFVKS